MNKIFGTILIIGALTLGGFGLWRGLYHGPSDEYLPEIPNTQGETSVTDSGLVAASGRIVSSDAALPSRLIIEKIGLNAKIQHLGVTKSGNMAAPGNFTDVAWYKYGTVPGLEGSAVISGHVDNALGTPAVFYDLHKLNIGDELVVVDAQGARHTFKVIDKQIKPYNLRGPELEKIYNRKGGEYLNLITCAGSWLPSAKTNDKRLVIYTELVK